ncbi:AzlD family protein [Desulfocurvus vexinensis]|uniref:AzlD family protein n=1 Tax=Desulfocurvus vexinensis TaxID=399548 RepID=UPI00048F9F1E|nr:AzlD domain-containing protein [Desulfocurvus vexinensis]
MSASAQALAAIAAMAAVTYATRAAGLFLVGRLRMGRRAEAFLSAIPGAVVVSLVAPAVLTQGPAEALAGLVALAVAATTRSLPLAMVAGVGAVWALRLVL